MFNPHGQFRIDVSHRVVRVACIGAWNLETMQLYAKACASKMRPLIGNPWAMLVDINEWELATPDVEPLLLECFRMAVGMGLRHEAVFNEQGIVKLDQYNVTLSVTPCVFERQFFTTESQALNWLREQGYQCDFQRSV